MKETVRKFNDVAIVGTYECNTDCEYCFSTRYIKPYKNISLTRDKFYNILDKLILNWVTSVSFIWWEPALWKEINLAISYAKSKWLRTTVFSNWMIEIKKKPDVFYIHLNVLFLTQNKQILKNLYEYSKNSKIVFIYNVYKPNKFSLNLLLKVLESFRFDFAVSFNIVFWDNIDESSGDFIYNWYKYITWKMWKNVISSWPLPHCIFNDKVFDYLKNTCIIDEVKWSANFENTDVFFPVINPDWDTLMSCAPINIKISSSYIFENDYKWYTDKFTEIFWEILLKENDFCKGCTKFNKQCQYGGILNLYSYEE